MTFDIPWMSRLFRGTILRIAWALKPVMTSIALTATALILLTSCSLGGAEPEQGNRANQRKAAQALLATQPGVAFTQDGAIDGGGSWAVNAVVTIDGLECQEILGLEKWSYGGEPMPTVKRSGTSAVVAITSSDGSAEVLR
ncbi:hypothetical protein SAMN04515691_0596 [Leifsonia sp. 98AMF]|uniref:hypothetical protein n=1 Tax=unclassified Leifsonia TaxID=2663824 RepID=UPI00087BA392|nr:MULTISPECIES: hypothetical protein [unclassified Leifsonia]SDH63925.1 hypothetical protein SAMN04515690_3423 [Leifsonia sp. 197AMF]SDI75495.1 hypothetical protein SAMN04515684_0365 [Leifsonia sp. 466MF]SDK12124.1 hypothetical protein SAMN04515683_2384 [Leifsonia sp. 157MF]SDN78698.1 hypothetical protein SAMN04515686_2567 [Leifsonia sp. 509MF]SEN28872.1 hypothetical protein SAMN04515685_2369 [Leifsonia sp. 467MF]